MLIVGPHVSKSTDRSTAKSKKARKMPDAMNEDLTFVENYGVKVCAAQIFVTGPQSFKETLTEEDKLGIAKYVKNHGTFLNIHGCYPDTGIWSGSAGAVHNVKQELRIAAQIGATGVIVHLAAGAVNDDRVKKVIEEIGNLDNDVRTKVTLWLEINSAKGSGFTFETPKKLHALFMRLNKFNVHNLRLGLCIDTAHVYACGYALDTDVAAKLWFDELNALLPNLPIMIHLNDCATAQGSGKDIHAVLCDGNIWKSYHPETGHLPTEDSGLVWILNYAEANQIICILERNDDDLCHDLSLLRKLGYMSD